MADKWCRWADLAPSATTLSMPDPAQTVEGTSRTPPAATPLGMSLGGARSHNQPVNSARGSIGRPWRVAVFTGNTALSVQTLHQRTLAVKNLEFLRETADSGG